ncbi:hypothetical protein FS837_010520 [Tulasnella sp. UAMH 9824]|nr:hypothetical protein FS837_010520 [Tulasnella sp. UAMH 9824]
MSESAAKQRAAARREAILNARGNRLSKLTSSARGDAAASLYDDPTPSPIRSSPAAAELLGEEPSMNMPRPSPSPSPASRRTSRLYQSSPGPPEDFSGGIPPEQEAMMRALLASMGGAAAAPGLPSLAPGLTPPGIGTPTAGGGPLPSDPFSAMLAQMASQQLPSSTEGAATNPLAAFASSAGLGAPTAAAVAVQPPKPKTLLQKLVPLLHAVSVLVLLAYFVFKGEPSAYEAGNGGAVLPGSMSVWSRWSSLVRAKSDEGGIQAVPIFAAFTTLQIVLHSIRIYNEPPPQPPAGILGMVISNLPPPFPNAIQTGLKYLQMGGAVMDDLSVLVFAVGVIVWGAGLFAVP